MDALGSAIRVDARGREVMRILPRLNEAVNEEWISDKTRFVFDGLRTQRLDKPYIRKDTRLQPATWQAAFAAIADHVGKAGGKAGGKIGAIAGDLASVEEMFALKSLMTALGSPNIDCRQDGTALNPALGRASYLFNATIEGIEDADALLIIGANPRKEAPVLNARIRKRWIAANLPIGVIGEKADLAYDYKYLGAGPDSISSLDPAFADILKNAERPLIVVGQGALDRDDGGDVLASAAKLAADAGVVSESWNGFCVLHTAAGRVGGLDIGFTPGQSGLDANAMAAGGLDVVFNLGADEIDIAEGPFVIYIGSHGDRGAHRADVILPGAAYTEKAGTFVNTEGRVQVTGRAAFPPGEAREDWAILRALSAVLDKTLAFDTLGELRAALYEAHPHMADIDTIAPAAPGAVTQLASAAPSSLSGLAFVSPVADFYLTNPIARASAVMAECSSMSLGPRAEAAE